MFQKYVGVGDVVFDIGAHVGFYTLIASALVERTGHVVAFEPLQENLEFLREHLVMNHVDNVTVIEKVVTDHTGTVGFRTHANRAMGGISEDGTLSVAAVSLDEFVESADLPQPDCIKIDVEGAEYRALLGARELLRNSRPVIFLSTHGRGVHGDCCRLLKEFSYDLIPIDGMKLETSTNILAIDRT